jgi:hypothetical protein
MENRWNACRRIMETPCQYGIKKIVINHFIFKKYKTMAKLQVAFDLITTDDAQPGNMPAFIF